MDNVFLDSNIWLYSFIKTQDSFKREKAKNIILSSNNIFISDQVVNEVCVNLLKKTQMNEVEIKELIKSFYKKYSVMTFNQNLLLSASDIREKYQTSFWDSLIISSALNCNCEIVYTEDLQHNQLFENKVKVVNPFIK